MGNEHTEYSGDIDVPVNAIQIINPQVVSKLPDGIIIKNIAAHGASFWTRTARLDAELDGEKKQYFLKTSFRDRGRGMMSGEFASMSLIYAAKPDLIPKLPDLHTFPAMLAELHRAGTSLDGRFGFAYTTYHGNTLIKHGWSNTWEGYFTRTTRELLRLEQEAQGLHQQLIELTGPFLEKVVPRLLRPLETGGRTIKPCLIHGDLWFGNASMDRDSELPIIFDAASFYAHNEYDLGVWRATWNKIGKPYITEYHRSFPVSPPEEDHDDRNALYATLIVEMKKLVDKFPGDYEAWEDARNSKA
ncbi:uncharacterized protein N0V89_009171 [Didymosphaeria variabile]|uniref:protein-ribulosamine 3-kinase n=1 Tax=Didymosphaeria variabile TaxID=1932322 RepID=A0A9W9C711_9PLEO|nr:uncharacterized protein N0V89_009171 [Didymosphaeria variabile]KAJ4347801.1 hypothetical protein N0V89_009171 [Didymosphaeria variabile]